MSPTSANPSTPTTSGPTNAMNVDTPSHSSSGSIPTVTAANANTKPVSKPSIFLKKKPTVASTGSRPLIKPFDNQFIDYTNPGKHDLANIRPARGTMIAPPGVSAASSASSTISGSTSLSKTVSSTGHRVPTSFAEGVPFTFDNHTTNTSSSSSTSLGSKRQATETAGRQEGQGGASTKDAFTILRIKRKRNEEPLDTLVVQEQLDKLAGKKQKKLEDEVQQEIENALAGKVSLPKPPPAVFRLATTVNKESFKDPNQSIQLRDKIAHLAEAPSRPRSRIGERFSTPEFGERVQERRGELAQAKQKEARTARYRVINQNRTGLSAAERQAPPQVKSSVEVQAEAALEMFKMYDAVREEEPKTKKQIAEEAEESDILCNFLPMVREYLSISDRVDPKIEVDRAKMPSTMGPDRSTVGAEGKDGEDEDSEDEYVYDIYYRDVNADHQQESRHRGIGSLLWFSDDEGNFVNEDDSSEDDYEDSDSNAEDYYQNDYPEDELSDDDLAYELSASDDDDYMY